MFLIPAWAYILSWKLKLNSPALISSIFNINDFFEISIMNSYFFPFSTFKLFFLEPLIYSPSLVKATQLREFISQSFFAD